MGPSRDKCGRTILPDLADVEKLNRVREAMAQIAELACECWAGIHESECGVAILWVTYEPVRGRVDLGA